MDTWVTENSWVLRYFEKRPKYKVTHVLFFKVQYAPQIFSPSFATVSHKISNRFVLNKIFRKKKNTFIENLLKDLGVCLFSSKLFFPFQPMSLGLKLITCHVFFSLNNTLIKMGSTPIRQLENI